MATTRIVRPALGIAFIAALLAGCGKPVETKKDEAPKTGSPDKVNGLAPPPPTPVKMPAGAEDAAKAFLADMVAGKADPAKLTVGFKKIVASPTMEADKDRGYSDWEAEHYLKTKVAGKAGPLKLAYPLNADTVIVTTGAAFLKLVKEPSGWLVDWVHIGPSGDRVWPVDTTGAAFVLAGFLDTVHTSNLLLSEALLSPGQKARIAPPLDDVDRKRGYNRSILNQKLAAFAGSSANYKIERINLNEATGKLGDGRPFTVKLAKGVKSGEWLIDDFQPQ